MLVSVSCLASARCGESVTTGADTAGGWLKSPSNPVLGGTLGTCFDVAVLKEGGRYQMWFSWRPRKSMARVESVDGVHWTAPGIALGPNPESDREEEINRPVVLKGAAGYHLW